MAVLDQREGGEGGFLREYLRAHHAACPVCGYDLYQQTGVRCPECGRGVRLGIRAAEAFLVPWIVTVIFVSMAAGFGVVVLIACVGEGFPGIGNMWREAPGACLAWFYGLACVPGLVWLVVDRKSFWCIAPWVQYAVAVVAVVVDVGLVVAAFATGRG